MPLTEKPRHRGDGAEAQREVSADQAGPFNKPTSAKLQAGASPVALRGKMDPGGGGYVPENDPWWDLLTEPGSGPRTDEKGRSRRVGRDPMTIPPDVLTAAGHPPRRTSSVVAALRTALDLDLSEYREYRDLRRYCLTCAENAAEVRRCAVIDCSFWPFRMGRNPHNPKRGVNPFDRRNGDNLVEIGGAS